MIQISVISIDCDRLKIPAHDIWKLGCKILNLFLCQHTSKKCKYLRLLRGGAAFFIAAAQGPAIAAATTAAATAAGSSATVAATCSSSSSFAPSGSSSCATAAASPTTAPPRAVAANKRGFVVERGECVCRRVRDAVESEVPPHAVVLLLVDRLHEGREGVAQQLSPQCWWGGRDVKKRRQRRR